MLEKYCSYKEKSNKEVAWKTYYHYLNVRYHREYLIKLGFFFLSTLVFTQAKGLVVLKFHGICCIMGQQTLVEYTQSRTNEVCTMYIEEYLF